MPPRTHTIVEDGQRRVWDVPRLWALSADLPVFDYEIAAFAGFDEVCWYGGEHRPTVRSVVAHCQRMLAADLAFPIILSASGVVMDGIHRLCKAQLEGRTTVRAVQFAETPPPDRVEPVAAPS